MYSLSFDEGPWDKKRIFVTIIGLVLFAGIAYILFPSLFPQSGLLSTKVNSPTKNVAGAKTAEEGEKKNTTSTQKISIESARAGVQDQLEGIKKEVTSLNIEEIASSSPQVQKVLNDIKALQDLPRNQARDLCQRICSSL